MFFFGAPKPSGLLRGSTSRRGAGGGMKFRYRRRKILAPNVLDAELIDYSTPWAGKIPWFLRRRPRAEGAGPAALVLFRGSANRLAAFRFAAPGTRGFRWPTPQATPCFPSRLRQPCGLPAQGRGACAFQQPNPPCRGLSPRRLHEPWRSRFAARGAGTLRLRLRVGLPSQAAEPFALRKLSAWSPCLSPGRRCRPGSLPASHLRRLASMQRSPAASLGGGLCGHSFCHSRESGNPGDPVRLSLSFPPMRFRLQYLQ